MVVSLVAKLSTLALRPVLGGVVEAVLPGVEFGISDKTASAVEQFFVTRFTDPSKQLRSALSRASDRSWRAVEIALSGESFWSWLTDRGEDKAFRADIRTFLDSNPLQLPSGRDDAFRRAALDQLRAARKAGLIPGDDAPQSAAKQTTDFLRFASPAAVCDAEWRVMAEVAGHLRQYRHAALADLLELRPVSNQPPLLAVAVRFFFRREVETNPQLFQGLVYDQVDHVGQVLEAGLGRLQDALQNHGERLLEVLALTETIHANVLDLKTEQAKLGDGFRDIFTAVFGLSEKLDRLLERGLRQTDATSIRGGAERQLVKSVKEMFRALSEPQRREAPALLNAIGKLEMAAGNYDEAHQDFRQVATIVNDRTEKAAAHHNAFLASLEKKDYPTALSELVEASRLDPERFSLFPLDRYEPERILGAGGFGIVFLCRNRLSKARMVVKALRTDELDRGLNAVLEEAGALEQLHHEAIIRLRDCGCADTNQTRPYLVMDFFEGVTLDDFVQKQGHLSAQDARVLARTMAEGLSAAHEKDILHRDVKPGNVLVQRASSGLRIKLIDFGLAMRLQAVHNTISNANALSNTIRGQSISGTVDYASPEQMGKRPGETITPRSDIYGYGRTLCFALFGTPKPGPDDWDGLEDKPFKKLIGECIKEDPKNRPEGFRTVLDRLGVAIPQVPVIELKDQHPLIKEEIPVKEEIPEQNDIVEGVRELEKFIRESESTGEKTKEYLRSHAPHRFASWLAAAENGNSAAQFLVSYCYLFGTGVEKDAKQYVQWIAKSADQGFPFSQFQVGCLLLKGIVCEKNETEGANQIRLAAEQGFAVAQFKMGECCEGGVGVTKNSVEAVNWYTKAGENGITAAQNRLAEMFNEGDGIPKDDKMAFYWIHKLAEQGSVDGLWAQCAVGMSYIHGQGVEKNLQAGIEWLERLLNRPAGTPSPPADVLEQATVELANAKAALYGRFGAAQIEKAGKRTT